MSVNVYLNERIRKHPGFKTFTATGVNNCPSFFNLTLGEDKAGRLYLALGDENGEVPGQLKPFVEDITSYSYIPRIAQRETGIYRHGTAAQAELDMDHADGKELYRVRMAAKNMDDIRTLLRKIKTGAIRPEESYEGPQGGKSRKELEDELAATKEDIRKLSADKAELIRQRDEIVEEVKNIRSGIVIEREYYATVLNEERNHSHSFFEGVTMLLAHLVTSGTWWRPFCLRSKVTKQLRSILSSKS